MTGHQQPTGPVSSLHQRLDINFALEAAGLGVWEVDLTTNQVIWDQLCRRLFGLAKDSTLPYERAIQHIHPEDRVRVEQAVTWALNPQSGGVYDQTYRTINADDGKLRWVRFQGRAEFTVTGEVQRFAGIAQEAPEQAITRQQVGMSESHFRSLVEQAPVAMAIFRGPSHIIEAANLAHLQLWGRQAEQVLGKPLFEALPEVKGLGYEELLANVLTTGEPYHAHELSAPLVRNGQLETVYFNFVYQPLREANGTVTAVTVVAIEITEQVLARQQIEETLSQMRSLVESAPFPIGVYTGRQMQIRLANQAIIAIYGKGPDVIDKSYLELLPELAGQQIFEQLLNVYETGIPFASDTQRINIEHQGRLVPYYFNYNFTPLFDTQGQVYGVMNTAADVTPLELARQQVEQTATALQNAIQLAQLGTFSVELATNQLTVSPRVADWFGFERLTADAEAFIAGVGERDRDYVRTSLSNALLPDSGGRYDVVHSVIHAKTGRQTIIHALGRLYLDSSGAPLKIEGTAQDITAQRELQLVLEQQVQERTEELAATSEELAASNEELIATNEDFATTNQALEQANENLTRSNQNLEQFAYIASHDLQEPLRKIQQFGDLLQSQYSEVLGEGTAYLQRMQVAASRMSVLIKDLLAFSRIATMQVVAQPVALDEVVSQALDSLSVAIEESGAQIEVTKLPIVQGDSLQLSQLFQNLLSNALKFRRTSPTGELVIPQVSVHAHLVAKDELPTSLVPARYADTYHLIEVVDNGIGFDEKYLDRIFQVFQRLHGKNEFAGTGVGLAIVQKVVTNHGGAITASGKPNQGATFSVYLPV